MSSETIANDQTPTEPRESVVRVREHLFKPLDASGLRRPRNQTASGHEAMRARLEKRLAYMGADNLAALVASLERLGEGPAKNRWPDEVTVWNIARQIQPPPDRIDRLLTSYMASRAGRAAWQRGPWEAVALARNLRWYGPPRHDASWDRIANEADKIRRHHQRSREGNDQDSVKALASLDAELAHVKGLVFPEPLGGSS